MLLLYSCLKATAGAQALPIASSSPCFFFFEGAVALDTERDTVEAERLRETRRSAKSSSACCVPLEVKKRLEPSEGEENINASTSSCCADSFVPLNTASHSDPKGNSICLRW